MKTDKELMQQALDALKLIDEAMPFPVAKLTIKNLRDRLAQQGQEPVTYTTGHCEQHKQNGGCQLHNLQCGWPDCDRKPISTPPKMQPCAGRNCGSTNPNLHSAECFEDYEKSTGMAQPVAPKCGAIIEVFGKDWRLEYMSLPVGKHKLYTQQYNYTAPAKRTPLTVEEVKKLIHPIVMADLSDEMTDFEIVRAIEAAHGIGENPDAP